MQGLPGRTQAFSSCSVRASHFSGFSCGTWTLASGLQWLWCTGLIAPRRVEFSLTRDRTHVSCIGRWIFNHWTTRGVLMSFLLAPPFNLRGSLARTIYCMFICSTNMLLGAHSLVSSCSWNVWTEIKLDCGWGVAYPCVSKEGTGILPSVVTQIPTGPPGSLAAGLPKDLFHVGSTLWRHL